MSKLSAVFIWIPNSLGGHGAKPYEGMRTTIRWQRFYKESLQVAQDVVWSKIIFVDENQQGKAVCELTSPELTPDKIDPTGEFVEFLSGYRVIAVGRVQQT